MNAPAKPAPVVTVDGHPVPPEAVAFELARLVRFYRQHLPEEQVRAQLPLLRKKAVEQAIGARLLIDEAGRLDLPVTDDEVDARVAAMRKQAGGAAKFRAILRRQNLETDTLREQIRRGRRVDKLIEQVTAAVPEPTEEEMRAHFDAHRDEYFPRPAGPGAAAPLAFEEVREKVREFLRHAARGAALAAHVAGWRTRARSEIVGDA